MKFFNGGYYVDVKDKRCRFYPTENILVRLWEEPKSLRTQYQVQNNTKIRKNQKVSKYDKDELIVEYFPKSKQPVEQQPNGPFCERNNGLEFDGSYYCQNYEDSINKQKHQIDK